MGGREAFLAHVESGLTSITRAWALTRADGLRLGFTDHDRDLSFDGLTFRADTGLTARALMQTTGLSVDNSEAVGALSDAAISEADIRAGRWDGAEVEAWLVNWADPQERLRLFRGKLGEVTRGEGAFQAELIGFGEALNQPQGFAFLAQCSAVLGDARCRLDLSQPGYVSERPAQVVEDGVRFSFDDFTGFDDRWFERGRMLVLSGAAAGLSGSIKNDRLDGSGRVIELWQEIRAEIAPGDLLRFEAGCDKQAPTCRLKFNNFLNFRGFPDIPGEDWLMASPVSAAKNDGGPYRSPLLGPGEG